MKNIFFLITAVMIAFSSWSQKIPKKPKKATTTTKKDVTKKKKVLVGIDISEYQDDKIDWTKVKKDKHKVDFIILRSTMGDDRDDDKFRQRIGKVRAAGFIAGAYHYYDPNELSAAQAANYIRRVKLQRGDFIPIVDIEVLSKIQSNKKLLTGLKNWLNVVKKHFGVKPMIYTSYDFYKAHLKKDFSGYPLWVAAYSIKKKGTKIVKNCEILQFTEKVKIDGITNPVDGDKMQRSKLKNLLLKK